MIKMTASFSHKPEEYECPFCCIWGIERPDQGTKQRDIIYQNEKVTAFIARKWWLTIKDMFLLFLTSISRTSLNSCGLRCGDSPGSAAYSICNEKYI